ncbi:MAG TPA: hypothetical protein VFK54_02405, partial [Candidatus Limnocylindrales bacterium]|nr:hypothetical protein [Candidatus Limnocylindrales bacterium]
MTQAQLGSFGARVGLVGLLAWACGTQVPTTSHEPTGGTAASPTGQATEAPDPPLRAEGMRLLGSVPGSNADFAFWGDLAIVTSAVDWDRASTDDGFVVIDIKDPASPAVVGRFECAGSFQDVSVWESLVVVSTDRITAGDPCGAQAAGEFAPRAFAGLRIVSIA